MTKIKMMVDQIDDELEGAKNYAEKYLEYKAIAAGSNSSSNASMWANRYKEMCLDELKHSGYIHDQAVQEIEQLKAVYTPPEEMLDAWNKSHTRYVEKAAWIKQMIAL